MIVPSQKCAPSVDVDRSKTSSKYSSAHTSRKRERVRLHVLSVVVLFSFWSCRTSCLVVPNKRELEKRFLRIIDDVADWSVKNETQGYEV